MFSLRTHVIILVAFFATLLTIGWGGAILEGAGLIRDPGALRWPLLIVMFALLLGLAFSAVPVMVMLALGFQKHVGNENVAAIAAVIQRQNAIIYVIWVLIALGAIVAIPVAFLGGAFNSEPTSDAAALTQDTRIGSSQGMLVARPGMTLDEVKKSSSLAIDATGRPTATGAIVGSLVFDFTVAGSNIHFQRCRYFFVSTFTHDPQRIESMSIGTSTFKLSHAALDAANADLRQKLGADGWLTGHEEYKTEESQALHGGAARGPEGDIWLKNETILHIEVKRMDDPVPGQNPDDAGEWIQSVSLWVRKDYPWIERYVFARPTL